MPSSVETNVRLVSVLTGFDNFTPIEQVTTELVPRQFALKGLGLLLAPQEALTSLGTAGGNIISISSIRSTAAGARRSASPVIGEKRTRFAISLNEPK